MSQKSKLNRARREAKQEKQAKHVVQWIFWGLMFLAVAYAGYLITIS